MAESEDRVRQDIGQDEAYIVNLKALVEQAQDNSGRSRVYFDALASNMVTTIASINHSISLAVQKQTENVTCVNATDFAERDIINSPWAEAMKTLMTQVMTEISKK